MTQTTLDVLDERFPQLDRSRARRAPTSATATKTSTFGTFAITFGIAFAILYTVFERLNWPLFTYHPVSGKLDFWRQAAGVGPPMFWYGWLTLSAAAAAAVGLFATMVPGGWLRRATVFCCALTGLWPLALAGLGIYIADWAAFDTDYLMDNAVWLSAIPAVAGAAAISYFVPSRWAERLWTSWLVIMPIGGLIVLFDSLLKPWFLR
jgi:hypothetical protein